MFTGLIEELGQVAAIGRSRGAMRLSIRADRVTQDLSIDDSVAINGVCLTVIEKTGNTFSVEAVQETLKKTTLDQLKIGEPVNLERAVRADSRLGGHFVQGHVDGLARVKSIVPQAGGKLFTFVVPEPLGKFIIPRGSIALDGVSLTIAEMQGLSIQVALIPHTLQVTTLGSKKAGDSVNVEVDMIGKYVVNLLEPYMESRLTELMNSLRKPEV